MTDGPKPVSRRDTLSREEFERTMHDYSMGGTRTRGKDSWHDFGFKPHGRGSLDTNGEVSIGHAENDKSEELKVVDGAIKYNKNGKTICEGTITRERDKAIARFPNHQMDKVIKEGYDEVSYDIGVIPPS